MVTNSAQHQPEVRLVATDVDGTLLSSDQQLLPRVQQAVQRSVELGVPVVVATGKARGPWAARILPLLGPAVPGVFMQGLLLYDGEGRITYSRNLDADIALQGIAIARQYGLTLAAYCGDRVLTQATDAQTDRLIFYGEPTPESVGLLDDLICKQIPCQKFILMASEARIDEVRPAIEERLGGEAHLTTALPGMLEVLPRGASKGDGLRRLLGELGVDPVNVLACGDGENDVEMLQLVGTSCAMGNAAPKARAAAQHMVGTNDEGGVADAIERFVLQPRAAASGNGP